MKRGVYLSETDFIFKDKTVLVKIDGDVDLKKERGKLIVDEEFRLKCAFPTINFLKEKKAKKIVLLGYIGRPKGKRVAELSLKPVADWFSKNLEECSLFDLGKEPKTSFSILENLRFNSGEEENDRQFAKRLSSLGDVYINDAFGGCHRKHASVVAITRFLPSFLGVRMEGEIRALSWLKKNAPRPLVFILGGSKSDKLGYIDFLTSWTDRLLLGGKLPLLVKEKKMKLGGNVIWGELEKNGKEITKKTIEEFKKEIEKGRTVIWAGPMGVYEEKGNEKGTMEIARAAAKVRGFKVAGGGDTHRIISRAKLWGEFNFVSVGGGAALQFLRDESLPGIEAITQ